MSRRRRTFLVVMTGIIAGIAVSASVCPRPGRLAMRTAQALERAWLVVTGRFIDVGGYRLRIECAGTGEVTVILEAGFARRGRLGKMFCPPCQRSAVSVHMTEQVSGTAMGLQDRARDCG